MMDWPLCIELLIQEYASWEGYIKQQQRRMLRVFRQFNVWPFQEIKQHRAEYLRNIDFVAFWLHHWLPEQLHQAFGATYLYHTILLPRNYRSIHKAPKFTRWLHNTPLAELNHNVPSIEEFYQWLRPARIHITPCVYLCVRFIDREPPDAVFVQFTQNVKTACSFVNLHRIKTSGARYHTFSLTLRIEDQRYTHGGVFTQLVSTGLQDSFLITGHW